MEGFVYGGGDGICLRLYVFKRWYYCEISKWQDISFFVCEFRMFVQKYNIQGKGGVDFVLIRFYLGCRIVIGIIIGSSSIFIIVFSIIFYYYNFSIWFRVDIELLLLDE